MRRFIVVAVAFSAGLAVACGANDKPLLANAPAPDPGAVAGVAAAAAAAVTLADPDAASRRPENNRDVEKKPIKVKEHVTGDVLDRLDSAPADGSGSASTSARQPGETKETKEPVDYGLLKGPLTKSPPSKSKPASDRPVAPLPNQPMGND